MAYLNFFLKFSFKRNFPKIEYPLFLNSIKKPKSNNKIILKNFLIQAILALNFKSCKTVNRNRIKIID